MEFFKKIGRWLKAHAPSKRRIIQVYSALLYNANIKGFVSGNIYRGDSKAMCVPGFNCYACPGAIGACPLGSLQNALASSGKTVPSYIFGILILFGLALGRTICGFLCPAGLVQELMYKIKTPKLHKSRATYILSYFKYVMLAVLVVMIPLAFGWLGATVPAFCKYFCPVGTLGGSVPTLIVESNSHFFNMLGSLFTWKFAVMIVLLVASVFIFRVFCRFFCPLGAIYGFFSRIALLGVQLDKNKCIDCGLCIQTCKMDIRHVGDHECIQCGACLPVCPTKAITWRGSRLFLAPTAFELKAAAAEAAEAEQVEKIDLLNLSGGAAGGVVLADSPPETPPAAPPQTPPNEEKERELVKVKVKKRNFRLEFTAWCLAFVVLIGALVYFNFIKTDNAVVTYGEGDKSPDFVATILNQEDTTEFDMIAARGKGVVIINFWYPDCQPCKEELPYFERFNREYGDKVTVLALETAGYTESEDLKFINNEVDKYGMPYKDYTLNFGRADTEVFNAFGGTAAYPMTVIIDAEGYIDTVYVKGITYEQLESFVLPLLG